ncbi:Membrane protein, major facilitator transporter family [Sulfitobacter noctilucicola]|uniref:MFS family permease n=1 Tax=Sulfitobacter noctilucicola TaxID=1342301 RepID=A0A7W6Q3X1_9RHOB|nr:MFS transporter [Sulfitobacter noctilucicola]KIN61935.1 Membrane protein, major facilitator transporter family [Sulfitobacter noctilucicola]MBB4173544.1 MFS family permease [Sulfitobacter noctilucicola]
MRQYLPIFSLLLGSAFLLFAGGINGLILPVRGNAEGFSSVSLGLLGTGWAVGYVAGCIMVPALVARVGHIRAFGALAAIAAVSMLGSAIAVMPWAWIVLRGVCGFCFAGAAMIVESWLSEQTDPGSRGRVFGVYTMVNLGANTAGYLMLTLGDTSGFFFFALAAIFYCLALVPTALSNTSTPAPLVSVKLNMKSLWRNSPVAVFAVFWVGVSNAAFGTLAPVYAQQVGLVLTAVAVFTAVPILAGAVMQMPIGLMSDRMDRRKVLTGVAVLALAADLSFIVIAPEGRMLNLALAALLGGSIYAMYPIIVAHANDHADPGTAIQISGGLLLTYGIGSIVGPTVAGWAMTEVGIRALFLVTACAHGMVILYTLWRMAKREAVAEDEKSNFQPINAGRTSNLQTAETSQNDAPSLETDSSGT